MPLVYVSQKQADDWRHDLGADENVFPDDEVEEIYQKSFDMYGDRTSKYAEAFARVTGIRRLLMQAAKMTTYTQNASSENLSDIYKNLRDALKIYQADLTVLPDTEGSFIRFGSMRKTPTTRKDYPRA